ncbi:hypothetical protein XM25_15990 [Devosia sp. H5989]|nr:hypothetical protein XM25_15990 [Devosia sp. H5989]
MAMRVATFANNDRMLASAMRTQSRMAELQLQQASGLKSTDYGGLGGDARKLISLETSLEQSKAYQSAAGESAARVEVLYSAMTTVTDLLTDFRSQLTAMTGVDGATTGGESLVSAAQAYLQELTAVLNTQYEGRYVFAGSRTTSPAIDLGGFVSDPGTPSTDYYQGDALIASVQVSSEQTVAYGVTADAPAFEQAIRAFSLIANGGTPVASADLEHASGLIVSALDASAATQSQLSIAASVLDRAQSNQADYQAFITTEISSKRDADATAVAVKLTGYETQLQASYSALAKIQSLNLLDYLR